MTPMGKALMLRHRLINRLALDRWIESLRSQ
jgi:hypothetical protein